MKSAPWVRIPPPPLPPRLATVLTPLAAAFVKVLDRPGGRTVLGLVASLRLSVVCRTAVLVHREKDAWLYTWRGGRIPHPALGTALHPEEALRILTRWYVPRAGDVVFDVGAGVGDTTLLFSKLVGDAGRVVAIEAHPETYRWLVRVCRENRLENVVPLELAVSDREGEESISDATLDRNTIIETGEGREVRVRRLDDLARELEIHRIDLLKMNIEGAEHNALLGAEKTIQATRTVCISCHDFLAEEGASDELRTRAPVEDFLMGHGFAVATPAKGEGWLGSYVYGTNLEMQQTA